jgi:hypothetical protein
MTLAKSWQMKLRLGVLSSTLSLAYLPAVANVPLPIFDDELARFRSIGSASNHTGRPKSSAFSYRNCLVRMPYLEEPAIHRLRGRELLAMQSNPQRGALGGGQRTTSYESFSLEQNWHCVHCFRPREVLQFDVLEHASYTRHRVP